MYYSNFWRVFICHFDESHTPTLKKIIGFHSALRCWGRMELNLLAFLRDKTASGTVRSSTELELPSQCSMLLICCPRGTT